MQEEPSPPPSATGPPPLVAMPPALYVPQQAPPVAGLSEDDKTMAMLCHLLGIFTGFLGPLIVWLVKKDQSPYIDHHGRESLNFQLTILLVMLALGSVTFVLMLVLVGFLLVPVLAAIPIVGLILEIIAALAAQRGEWHRYPFCIRMV